MSDSFSAQIFSRSLRIFPKAKSQFKSSQNPSPVSFSIYSMAACKFSSESIAHLQSDCVLGRIIAPSHKVLLEKTLLSGYGCKLPFLRPGDSNCREFRFRSSFSKSLNFLASSPMKKKMAPTDMKLIKITAYWLISPHSCASSFEMEHLLR